jgi:hypothetical protein
MATLDVTLKRKNGATHDTLHPTTSWSQIEDKPTTFTPTAHTHTLADVTDITATVTEVNYTDGVTSNIQTQLNGTVKTTGDQSIAGTKTFTGNVNISGVLDLTNAGVIGALDLSNNSITGVNAITITDPGPEEGVLWAGGNLWKIYESPNDLTTNGGGNLQIVQSSTRRATFNTSGQLELPVSNGTAPLVVSSTTAVSNLNADLLDGNHAAAMMEYQSLSEFASGTLVRTSIDASVSTGDSFVIEIVGKSYSTSAPPFKYIAQGYLYAGSIINYSGLDVGANLGTLKIFEDSGNLCFWWARISYWNSFKVRVYRASSADSTPENTVTAITDSTEPTGTKKVTLNAYQVFSTYHLPLVSEVSGLQTALDGKASTSHTHAISDVTNLQTTLDAKEPLDNTIIHNIGTITNQDWNTYIDGTEASWVGVSNHSGSNRPSSSYTYGLALNASTTSAAKFQLYAPETGSGGNGLWYRTGWNATYRDWVRIWDSGNDGASSGLDADLLDGNHASAFALTSHSHTISDVTNLQTSLDAKAADNAVVKLTGDQTIVGTKTFSSIIVGAVNGNSQYLANNNASPVDANSIWRAGVYTWYNGTNVPSGDFGLISIPTWGSTSSSSRYNLQIGANIGGSLRYRTTDVNGAGTFRTVWDNNNDGTGSGLDADLLDGQHGSYYAPLASPALTGTPTAPTATAGTNTTQLATTAFVSTAVANLINSAPATLDTLDELAAALGDDANFATTVTNSLAGKLSLSGGTMTLSSGTTSNGIFFNTAQTFTGPQIRGKVQELYRDYYLSSYKIWDEGNDGAGSTLDADLLDGNHASAFALASHTHAATDITSGTIATARLGSGTANTTTFLRGDNTWSTAGIATYSTATLYVKRIWSRTLTGGTWTSRYNAGTGAGTAISTTSTFTTIALGYTPASTDQFMIEFSNNTSDSLEKGICIVGGGTFSSTAGMSVISYDAYETVDASQLKIAKYYAQWYITGTSLGFRYGSKMTW